MGESSTHADSQVSSSVSGFTEKLAELQPSQMGALSEAATLLPDPTDCRDSAALRTRARLPDDPRLRRAVEREDAELARAGGIYASGRFEAAHRLLRNIIGRAQKLGHGPLLAEAHRQAGAAAAKTSRYILAIDDHEKALRYAVEADLEQIAAQATMYLIIAQGYYLGDRPRALQMLPTAQARITRAGDLDHLEAQLLSCAGILDGMDENYQKSADFFRREIELRQEFQGEDHLDLAMPLGNLSSNYRFMGEYETAAELARASIDIIIRHTHSRHPRLIIIMTNLALIYVDLGEFIAADDTMARAIEICRHEFGSSHRRCAPSIESHARMLLGLGYFDRALILLAELRDIDPASADDPSISLRMAATQLDSAQFENASRSLTLARDQTENSSDDRQQLEAELLALELRWALARENIDLARKRFALLAGAEKALESLLPLQQASVLAARADWRAFTGRWESALVGYGEALQKLASEPRSYPLPYETIRLRKIAVLIEAGHFEGARRQLAHSREELDRNGHVAAWVFAAHEKLAQRLESR